ncbi:MAG: Modification methylase AplI [Phycisphaerae bacterium]|nr:Modification methylase AplI [Phycisphaerae bacterium]
MADNGVTSIELFAGAGGLALGAARAGLAHVAAIERDAGACDTLRRNKQDGVKFVRDWEIVEGSVEDYDLAQHAGKVAVVCGGPPCQPFSLGGNHAGHEDERNLFPEAIRAVREIMPKAFVFENVKGLLRGSFLKYYNYILHRLRFPLVGPRGDEEWLDHLPRLERLYTGDTYDDLHYKILSPSALDSADYGVPQRRERVLIVGVRSDLGMEFSYPPSTHSEDGLLYDQWVSGEYWDRHGIAKSLRPRMPSRLKRRIEKLRVLDRKMLPRAWRTVRDAISSLPRIAIGQTSRTIDNHFLNPGARAYAGHTGSVLDWPAKTLKAGDHGVPGGENMVRLDDSSVRYFSVRECARLQTFPDDWVFEGTWTGTMRQLGNAVPVELAEIVVGRLVEAMRVKAACNPTRKR